MEEKTKRKYRRTAPTKAAPYGYNLNGVPKIRLTKKAIASGINIVKMKKKSVRREKQGFLKYFQIVMRWAMEEHELSMDDLQCLLFLYDEDMFTSKDIKRYSALVKISNLRLKNLHKKGLLSINSSKDGGHMIYVYEVSHKGKKFCNSIYKKMTMEEKISEVKFLNYMANKTHSVSSSYVVSVNRFNELFNERRDAAIVAAKKKREENAAKRNGRKNAWDGSYKQ